MHHLRCETGRWRVSKEVLEERTCIYCNKGVVEIEWHFIMEYVAYEDIHIHHESNLKVNNMHDLFDEDKINQIASVLVKIHSRRFDNEKSMNMS